MLSSPAPDQLVHDPSRRSRITATILVLALVALVAGTWISPEVRRWASGPSADQVALQRETARANDLKRQVDELTAQLRKPQPPATDAVQQARADDLARQVDELGARLAQPRPPVTDGVQRARADDLAQRVNELNAAISRPRPIIDPLSLATASLTKAQIVASRNLFGLYTTQSPFNYAEMDLVQAKVARKPNIVGYFQSFKDPFDARPIRSAWLHGQVPLLTWESQNQVGVITADAPEFSLPRILAGAYDDVIRSYARGIRDLAMPVILRFDHEMNGNWYPWAEQTYDGISINGNNKGDYVRTWRHVHDIFAAEGANDYTIWLWSPNRINRICGMPPPADFYPGDNYTDWVGMSGYYRAYQFETGPCDDVAPGYDGVFGATLPELRPPALPSTGKPIFLSEIGATENTGHKPEFINDLFAGLNTNPDIIGFAWFSLAVTSGNERTRRTNDWRIDSSAQSVTAMRDALAAYNYGTPLS